MENKNEIINENVSNSSNKAVINLVFQENLLKSLNKIYEKQNYELLKIVSNDKIIPFNELIKFMHDEETVDIPCSLKVKTP
jgi:hypothetical protein